MHVTTKGRGQKAEGRGDAFDMNPRVKGVRVSSTRSEREFTSLNIQEGPESLSE